jgi:hypothetical protein
MKTLNVTEKAFGKTVSCPGCNLPINIPHPAQPSRQASDGGASPPWSDAAQNGDAMPVSTRPVPAKMPPMPPTDGAFDFLNASAIASAGTRTIAKATQGLNLADMFSGNEKEHVFSLLTGEERLEELTIHHQHLFIVKSGVTRVTLTTHRLLYTETRVFSPVYWLLLVLFPPLIFYYVIRLSRNRNVAIPLGSIDSVEKRYRPHWLWFVLAIILGYMVASLCGMAVTTVFGGGHHQTLFSESSALEVVVKSLVLGLLGPAVLILLLATRIVGIEVVTFNNRFFVRFSPADVGVNEGKFDAFLQSVHAQMERARTSQSQPNSSAT